MTENERDHSKTGEKKYRHNFLPRPRPARTRLRYPAGTQDMHIDVISMLPIFIIRHPNKADKMWSCAQCTLRGSPRLLPPPRRLSGPQARPHAFGCWIEADSQAKSWPLGKSLE